MREPERRVIVAKLKEVFETTCVKMLTLTELRHPHSKQRWNCRRTGMFLKHPTFWASPTEIIEHGEAGRSGCPVCRQLDEPTPVVDFETFKEAIEEQQALLAAIEKPKPVRQTTAVSRGGRKAS